MTTAFAVCAMEQRQEIAGICQFLYKTYGLSPGRSTPLFFIASAAKGVDKKA
jgi:hypothetical protein